MESRSWLYLLGAAALGAAILGSIPVLHGRGVKIGQGDRVLLIGDSLAQGMTAPFGAMASDVGVQFYGDGRVSTRLDQWLNNGWAEEVISQFQPTVVIVSIGTNDSGAVGLLPEFASRAQALVALARSHGASVLWVEPLNLPSQFDLATVTSGIRSSGADATFASSALDIPRGPDNIHPTMAGYAAWAAAVWQSANPPAALKGYSGYRNLGATSRTKRTSRAVGMASLGTFQPRSSSLIEKAKPGSSLNRTQVYSTLRRRT